MSGANNFTIFQMLIIHNGDFFLSACNLYRLPGKFFGFMDADWMRGPLAAESRTKTQEKLQRLSAKNSTANTCCQAVLIETEFPEIPYCISAPTMRVPLI